MSDKLKNVWTQLKAGFTDENLTSKLLVKGAENVGSGMNESAKKLSLSGYYIDISKKGLKIKKSKKK